MSHRSLMNFVHGGGMTSFHVGGGESSRSQRRAGGFAAVEREAPRLHQFSTKTGEHAYDSPKKREKKHDGGDDSDDGSGDEQGSKKKRLYHPGEDAGERHLHTIVDDHDC